MSNENRPLVSVIVCVYNSIDTIDECIASVLNQTEKDIELVLVDDGSTDGSSEKCDIAAANDSRVRVIHKPNGGVSSARNAGLAAAAGKNIVWLDSDDTYELDMVELMLKAKQKYGVKYVVGNYVNHYPDRDVVRYDELTEDIVIDKKEAITLLAQYKLSQSLCISIAERELYNGIVFPEGYMFEDIRNSYKLVERAGKMVMIAKPVMHRLVRSESISHLVAVERRVDGVQSYIDRYNDLVERWPGLKKVMLTADFRHSMRLLRRNIIRCSYADYRKAKDGVKRVCRFYRKHASDILPKNSPLTVRLSFHFVTAGSYSGFYISRIIDRLNSKHREWLEKLPLPDPEH